MIKRTVKSVCLLEAMGCDRKAQARAYKRESVLIRGGFYIWERASVAKLLGLGRYLI